MDVFSQLNYIDVFSHVGNTKQANNVLMDSRYLHLKAICRYRKHNNYNSELFQYTKPNWAMLL